MNNKKIMRSQQVFKSERHVLSTIRMKKKNAHSNNDDKRLIDFNRITTHAEQMLEKFLKMNY